MAPHDGWTRRRFLEIAGLAGGVVALNQFISPVKRVHASPQNPQLLLFAYFEGGWDQLLTLDPRDNTLAQFQRDVAYAPTTGSGIHPAYDLITETATRTLLSTNASGVQRAGNLTFGPAIPQSFLAHAADMAIVRGMGMDTLTHEVGRRYFLTGKFPRGLTASGSSATTAVAALEGASAILPNLAILTESYNETFPPYASPIRVSSAAEVLNALKPIGVELSPSSQAAIEAFEQAEDNCAQHGLNGTSLVDYFRASRKRAKTFNNQAISNLFQFNVTAPPAEVQPLFSALGITTATDLAGPKGRAAIAGQALANGVSQAVSVALATGLDDHFDWDIEHAPAIRLAFDALGNLIKYLKTVPFKGGSGSVWDHTTLVVFSEFTRTPLLNTRNGRDHHLASSCLVAGPGIRRNTVVGATSDSKMAVRRCDFKTGVPDDKNGLLIRPSDVHATIFQSMGLSYDHISNNSPRLIEALLR